LDILWSLIAVESLLREASLRTTLAVASDSDAMRLAWLLLRHAGEDRLHATNKATAGSVIVVHAGHQLLLVQLLLVVILLRKSRW